MFSHTHTEQARHQGTVLSLLWSTEISLKIKKYRFFQPKVHYLGHVICLGKLSVADTTADAFKTFTFPRTLTQVRSFFEACNVYRQLFNGVAKIARPLNNMTDTDSDPDFYNPTEAQAQAFENPKQCTIAPLILAHPRYGRPYMIETDASAHYLGSTLLQEDEDPHDWRPMGYFVAVRSARAST